MSETIIRSLAAFLSGAVVFPLLLFALFRAMFPVEATGYGNLGFWAIVLSGAGLAAIVVWFKQVPLWLAVVAGLLGVLVLLLPWVVWKLVRRA